MANKKPLTSAEKREAEAKEKPIRARLYALLLPNLDFADNYAQSNKEAMQRQVLEDLGLSEKEYSTAKVRSWITYFLNGRLNEDGSVEPKKAEPLRSNVSHSEELQKLKSELAAYKQLVASKGLTNELKAARLEAELIELDKSIRSDYDKQLEAILKKYDLANKDDLVNKHYPFKAPALDFRD